MRIPEVWRWTANDELIFLGWTEADYRPLQSSQTFPWIKPELLHRFALRALKETVPLVLDDFNAELRRMAG